MKGSRAPKADVDWESIAKATLHPLQVRLLEHAAASEERFSPSELAAAWDEPLGNVSYHVRTLVALKLLESAGTKTVRGALKHYYRGVAGVDDAVRGSPLR